MNVYFQNNYWDVNDPNICPHCHVVSIPQHLWSVLSMNTDNTPVFISSWECSNEKCRKVFLVNHNFENNDFVFSRFLNGLPKGPDWPKPIADLLSGNPKSIDEPEQTKFIKTYLQSLVAENNGLDEIAGMGFRKSIEYLVKDWAIQLKPDDREKIEGLWLGGVISEYFNGELKDILDRATWLGNDQAHYNRLFDDFDLNDLKELIALIMVELDRQYKMKQYIEGIQKRK